MTTTTRFGLRAGLTATIFAAGFLCGSVTQQPASADMKDLTGAAMDAAGGQGGALGAAAKLGTSITDMQTHLDALNKNLDTLKEIKGMLGG
jgi:hypothetical protein